MNRCISVIAIILAALTFLDGCTLFTTYKISENIIDKEIETFAGDETQGEEIAADSVETAVDESEEDLPADASHKYIAEIYSGELVHPDGTLLATYEYSYPVFECNEGDNAECIRAINQMFKDASSMFVRDIETEYETLVYEYEDSKEYGYEFRPYDYVYDYGIHMDAKGILSVVEIYYSYTGGAHGNTYKESHTFDTVNGKELSLSDLLYGTDEEITEAFIQKFLESEYVELEFFDDPSETVRNELVNAQYYVDALGVTAYFQQYQVGPYVAGFVSATITDKQMLKFDFSDMTEE